MAATLEEARRALDAGGLVVYPTDTLLGLGARATDAAAVARLAAAKARPADQPLSVAVDAYGALERWTRLTPGARAFARRHLPGPYTLLLPVSAEGRRRLAPGLVGPGGRLGVRIPDHPVARALARDGPITCTSANRHAAPATTRPAAARAAFGDAVAVYLDAAPRPSGRPSTLVDLAGARPRAVARR